jgi:hypothetical protein
VSAADVLGPSTPLGRGQEIPRAFARWYAPVWIAFVTFEWWLELRRPLADALDGAAPLASADVVAAFAALGRLGGNAIEALFYVAWWRGRGARLGFARCFEWLVTISVLDLLGANLSRLAQSHPGWIAHLLSVFAGIGALRVDESGLGSGLSVAFGSLGLLAIARIVATAALQRQGAGGGLAAPLTLTLAAWLPIRLATWWLVDLARGLSPLP